MQKNIPGDKCPMCGAEEVEANTPRTVFACGSSNFDNRPRTFRQSDNCDSIVEEMADYFINKAGY